MTADGTTFDLSAYEEFGVLLSFHTSDEGTPEFIDFLIYPAP